MPEGRKRTIAKTISWRIVATVTTVSLVYIGTGEITLSLGIGVAELFLKMALYYGHERLWLQVR